MRRAGTLIAVAVAAGTIGLSATGAAGQLKVIGSGSASGDYAVTIASGNASAPHALYVNVTSSPPQSVLVSWSLVCSRGLSAGSKSGQFRARTPLTRSMKFPMTNVSSCIVSADAQLSGSGAPGRPTPAGLTCEDTAAQASR